MQILRISFKVFIVDWFCITNQNEILRAILNDFIPQVFFSSFQFNTKIELGLRQWDENFAFNFI